MHSLKILPLSPLSLRCPVIVCSSYQTVVSCHPPAVPILVLQPRSPPQPSYPALSRCHRRSRTLRRYRGSCVMAGARNVQRSFVGVV